MKQSWSRTESKMERWQQYYTVYPGIPPKETKDFVQNFSSDLLVSQNNLSSMLGRTRQQVGGNFLVVRRFYQEFSTLGKGRHHFSRSSNPLGDLARGHYYGPQYARFATFNNSHFPVVTPSSGLVMNKLGSEAIAKTAPTDSEADLSTFLGELREGLPRVVGFGRTGKDRARRSLNAGDEYLNVEFGWKPLVRDVRSFADAISNAEKAWDEYLKNSGKRIKASYSWPIDRSTSVSTGTANAVPGLSTNWYKSQGWNGTLTTTTTSSTERWFRGCWMYHVPDDDFNRRRSQASKLYGLDLDPETLWNVAPWSWAADWVGNVGTLAENASNLSKDGLVLLYGYVMEHKITSVEYQLTGIRYQSYPGEQTFRQTFTTEVKQRVQATPYGFGLAWDQFSPRQAAILGALGISRAR